MWRKESTCVKLNFSQEKPMKLFARLTLMGSGLGLIFLMATPSFATVVGALTTGGTATVTVTADSITFDSPIEVAGVGGPTTLTFAGGTLANGQPIDINGGNPIMPTSLPVMATFPSTPNLSVTLDTFGPGSSNTNCAGLTTGESCSISLGGGLVSPIILTYTGPGTEGASALDVGTTAILDVSGTATDDGGATTSLFGGHFSASLADDTPAELETLFSTNPSASFTTTTSGSFVAVAGSAVPEPRAISFIGLACLFMGIVIAKRRKSVA